MERLLTIEQVREYVPKSRTTLWRWVREGLFPEPVPVGAVGKVWLESEIEQWLETQKQQRKTAGKETTKDQ